MIGLDAREGVDVDFDDFLRCFLGHRFNVHAPGFAGHDDILGGGAIRQDAQVELFGDIKPLFDEEFAHETPLRSGLMRHQGHAEDFPGQGFDLVQRLRQFDAAALAPAAGMNLGFDQQPENPAVFRRFAGLRPG